MHSMYRSTASCCRPRKSALSRVFEAIRRAWHYYEPMPQVNPAASRARPLSVRAYDQLLTAIVRCDIAPGTWMKASEFSELLGVGRSPTVQALTRLEEVGFARPVKRKGWQITPVTLQGVRDVLEAWRMIAPSLAVLAIRNASDEQISTLRRLTTDWAPGHPISEGGFNIDSAPFQRFAEICGNPFMAEMTSGLSAHVERVMNFALRQGSFVDEAYNRWRDAVFDAMEERAEKRASHAMVRLVGVGESELFRILQRTDSLLSIPLRAERAS
jgi:DNA-binding GntR family transcriptional regulator